MINRYLWFLVVGTLIDFLAVRSGFACLTSPSVYHLTMFLVVVPLVACVIEGAFKYGPSWKRAYKVIAFTILYSIVEDFAYIMVESLILWKWLLPVDYAWQAKTYAPWFYQIFGQNWWLNLPTGYWIGGAVSIGLLIAGRKHG